ADYWVQVKTGASTWKSPSETGTAVIRVSVGDLFKVTPIDSNWVKIKRNGEESYLKISNVQTIELPYLNLNFRTISSVTAAEINRYIQNYETQNGKVGSLHDQGQNIIDVANRSGVNAALLAAMAVHESGYGTSGLAMAKFNVFSQAAYDRQAYDYAYRFESVQHAIEFQAEKLKRDYLTLGGKYFNGAFLGDKSGGMNIKYASDESWGAKIAIHANKIHAYNANEYAGALISAIPVDATKISFPDYIDDFSNLNIMATVINGQKVNLSATRDTSTIIKTLSGGANFRILCKYNDNDMKVLYDNKEYFFYGYSNIPNFIITNLVRKNVSYSQTQYIYYEQNLSASTASHMTLKDTVGNIYTVADNSDFVKPFRK
ncbi:MAG: peptide-binding protein, partial [Bacillales bacterium]|nr:peptide-binding protein [Bacillales bacterium]